MTDFDLLFSRLRGLAWSHVAMAGACFVFATALFVSPAWGYADFARLHNIYTNQLYNAKIGFLKH